MLDVRAGVDDDELLTREKELNEGRRRAGGAREGVRGGGIRVARVARADDALALGLLMQDRPLLRKCKGRIHSLSYCYIFTTT
jgi:hypothetical protein